jgi:DNA-binding XRE family transcriptional regulator
MDVPLFDDANPEKEFHMRNVGSAVRHAREAKGWSQAHLAQASGLSRRTILRIENGTSCSGESLMALGAALEMDLIPPTEPKSGRCIVVHVPDVIVPSWLRSVFAPRGYGNDVPIRLVSVFLAFAVTAGLAGRIGDALGPNLGSLWFQGSALAIFLYSILFSIWFVAELIDAWLDQQEPA